MQTKPSIRLGYISYSRLLTLYSVPCTLGGQLVRLVRLVRLVLVLCTLYPRGAAGAAGYLCVPVSFVEQNVDLPWLERVCLHRVEFTTCAALITWPLPARRMCTGVWHVHFYLTIWKTDHDPCQTQ